MPTNILCPCGSGYHFNLCCEKKYKSIQYFSDMDVNTASKYDLWSSTRAGLYQAIAKQLNQIPKEDNRNIIILGAGSCIDLPMDYICENFSEIVLVDIDEEALKESNKYIPPPCISKVTYVTFDITSMLDSFTTEIEQTKEYSLEATIKYLNSLKDNVPDVILPEEIKRKMPFSVVISDFILSQLHINFFSKMLQFENIQSSSLVNAKPFIDSLTMQHIKLLHSIIKVNGRIFVLTDMFAFGFEFDGSLTPFSDIVSKHGLEILKIVPEGKIIQSWFAKYPIVAGNDVMHVLKKNNFTDIELDTVYFWWWIFSNTRRYFVNCFVFSPATL